jgi:hypothetical protein
LLLAILSGLAFQKEGRSAAIVSWALVAVSVLLHPAVGLFWVAFISVIMLDRETPITRFLAYAAAASISVAMVGVVYHQQSDLSAQEFADIYARLAHFGHYIPTLYSSFSGQRWFIPLVILSGVLAATGAGLWFGERSKLAIASWTAAVAVNLAIATQYVLVELYPVSSVVQLGPSRFTQFGGWFLVYFGAALVCVGMKYVWPAPEIPETTLSRRFSVIWVTAVFLVIFGTSKLNYVTKPAIAETMNWIAHNTKAEDRVVAALPAVHAARILADRPVIAGYNFPFHVMHFREFRARTEMIYGSAHEREALDGSNAGSGSQRFFGQHGPCAFLEMRRKYGADIAVVETRFAAPLSGEMPVARNDELSVYLIRDFKARDCEARS